MNEPHKPVGAIFDAAMELPPERRAAYVQEACAGDDPLRQRVEALLRAHESGESFMNSPAVASRGETVVVKPAEQPGDRIGRYKLLQQIGEGGCGVVYMAEQQEPVRRRVALKVIKLGMDTRQVIARFEAERQALALMDHPNIAKIYDAGVTQTTLTAPLSHPIGEGAPGAGVGGFPLPSDERGVRGEGFSAGRPYFVMELVRGIKITDYCDENNLSTEQRLDLFVKVCQAVQHAHQKGIIHRDIKPSNVLVADHDGVPVPKIIDFGIAKATTDQRLTDKTLFTAFEQFIGTPAYMSPEQARMSGLDIDTRTDIYSLGALLYELLTGRTPFDAQELVNSGLEAMRRTISEKEPARPSTRLSTMLEGELTTTAKHRRTDAPKLIHLLRGDLDWIVMKALEKDRGRRYDTANGLARDVERHLADEPVVARPPSNLYRFQKLARRNKLAFTAAAAISTVLVLGVVVSTWQAIRARRAERVQSQLRQQAQASQKKSETEAAKATAISDFLQQLLSSANPDALKGSEYTVRQLLDDFSAGLGKQLAGQPEVEATVRATMGNAYYRLGATDKAEPHLERALALRRGLYGEQSEAVAQSLVDHAWNLSEQARQSEAEAEARRALGIYRKLGADAQPLIHTFCALGTILNLQERFNEVETISEEALALARSSPGRDFPEIANITHNLADTKVHQAKFVEAENLALQAADMHRRLQGPEHPETAWSLLMLGRALAGQHKLAEAERTYQEALGIFRRRYSFQHSSVQLAVRELAAVLEGKGDSAAVEALYREVLAGQRAALGNESPAVAQTLSSLADNLISQGRQLEAEATYREAIADYEKLVTNSPNMPDYWRELARSHNQLNFLLRKNGRKQEAEVELRKAHELWRQHTDHRERAQKAVEAEPENVHRWDDLGESFFDSGEWQAAITAFEKCDQLGGSAWQWFFMAMAHWQLGNHEVARKWFYRSIGWMDDAQEGRLGQRQAEAADLLGLPDPGTRSTKASTCFKQGDVYQQQRETEKAKEAYGQAVGLYETLVADFPKVPAYRMKLIVLLTKTGRQQEVEKVYRQLESVIRDELAARRKLLGNEHPDVAFTLEDLAVFLRDQGKLAEAETTIRESLAIRQKRSGNTPPDVTNSLNLLADLLRAQGKYADAKTLYHDAAEHADARTLNGFAWFLATSPNPNLRDGTNAVVFAERAVAATNRKQVGYLDTLAAAYAETGQFAKAISIQQEAIALSQSDQEKRDLASKLKLYENHSPYRDHNSLAELARNLLVEGKFAEAEGLARECLAIRERAIPDDWRTFNAQSMLGGAFLGQKNFAQAEPLLLSGYEGMKQREVNIPLEGKARLSEAVQRLVQLYEAADRPDQAAEWKKKLAGPGKAGK